MDDTLYENTSVIIEAELSLIKFMHDRYPVTKNVNKDFWRAQQKLHFLTDPLLKNDMGKLRQLSLKSGFMALGLSGNELDTAIKQCFEHFYFQRSNFCLHKNIHFLLKTLSDKLPLVAITNGNVNLQQIGLDNYFSACFKASIELPMKPNKAMFAAAQVYLNILPENILHVGDNLQSDIYGALKAGYQTAWYAEDRKMNIRDEKTKVLPHVQLNQLTQLLALI